MRAFLELPASVQSSSIRGKKYFCLYDFFPLCPPICGSPGKIVIDSIRTDGLLNWHPKETKIDTDVFADVDACLVSVSPGLTYHLPI